jgi:hypothetical protein
LIDPKRAALYYANYGWPVVPLHFVKNGRCSCGRVRCDSPGKHPMTEHGLKDASRNGIQHDHWWSRWPGANIGIRTGADGGLIVIDVDPRHGGDESLAELVREHGKLPATVEALTGGGGRHLVFKPPGGTVPNRSNMRPGSTCAATAGTSLRRLRTT